MRRFSLRPLIPMVIAGLTILVMAAPSEAQNLSQNRAVRVVCSTQQTPKHQLACGKKNLHRGTTAKKFLRRHPGAGTISSRESLKRASRYLIRYGSRHIRRAESRMYGSMPPIDSCLREIIRREGSGFVLEDRSTWARAVKAKNASSGAGGIPQALPPSKMKSAGRDWKTNAVTQIRWMIGYIVGRYQSCSAALAHHNAYGWY